MKKMSRKKKRAPREPHCRICGCTHFRPCPAGCDWDKGEDICTVCAEFREELQQYVEFCNRVTAASLRRLLREAA